MNQVLKDLQRTAKRALIKIVPLEQAFPNLEKTNLQIPETIFTPEVENMRFIDEAKYLHSSKHSTPLAYTTILKGVFYCPRYNVVLTRDRKVISESFTPQKLPEEFKLSWLFRRNIQEVSGYCTIFNQLSNNYYHYLIDNAPRFYLACQHEIIRENQAQVYLLQTTDLVNDFFLSKMIPKNVTSLRLQEEKLFYIENLVFATFVTRNASGFMPSKFREAIYSRFLPKRASSCKNRIFVSRAKAPLGRHIANENELMTMLEEFGFQKYLLEDMSISQQIELFYDAEIVVAPHGAGLTNLLFCGRKIKVLELFQRSLVTPHYYFLSKSMGHDYYWWCSTDLDSNHYSSFEADLAKIKKMIERIISG